LRRPATEESATLDVLGRTRRDASKRHSIISPAALLEVAT